MKEMISRRSFLHVMGLGFGAAMLTACNTGTADSPADSPAAVSYTHLTLPTTARVGI